MSKLPILDTLNKLECVIETPKFNIKQDMHYIISFLPPDPKVGKMKVHVMSYTGALEEAMENTVLCFGNEHTAFYFYFNAIPEDVRKIFMPIPGRALYLLQKYNGDLRRAFSQYNNENDVLKNENEHVKQ